MASEAIQSPVVIADGCPQLRAAATPLLDRRPSCWAPLQPHEWTRSMSEASRSEAAAHSSLRARSLWARALSQRLSHRLTSIGSRDERKRRREEACKACGVSASLQQELDALEACAWLIQAGFPQYVQLFEEKQLPVDPAEVAMDHDQLSEALLKPLYRRLQMLTKLSKLNLDTSEGNAMKFDGASEGQNDLGTLSFKWQMDKKSKKWCRKAADMLPAFVPASQGPAVSSGGTCGGNVGTGSCDSAIGSGGDASPLLQSYERERLEQQTNRPPSRVTAAISVGLSKSQDSVVSPAASSPSSSSSGANSSNSSPILSAGRGCGAQKPTTSASCETAAQGVLVIGEPVLIRSAQTDERLRQLGCLDPADASQGSSITSRPCSNCGSLNCTQIGFLLSPDYVPGTFPLTMTQTVIRRECRGLKRPTTSAGALSSHSLTGTAGGSRDKERHPAASRPVYRRNSLYDNVPAVVDDATADRCMQKLDDVMRGLGEQTDLKNGSRTSMETIQTSPDVDVSSAKPMSGGESDVKRETTACDKSAHEERRDSGVGLSLTREPANSKVSRKKTRKSLLLRGFGSFPEHVDGRDMSQLTANQLAKLRRLSLIKITGLLEEHCPRDVANSILSGALLRAEPKQGSRIEHYDLDSGSVFGVPLHVVQQTEGYPLPLCIRQIMASLRQVAQETVGIFRRPGVKSRIQKLHCDLDAHLDVSLADGAQAYDLADLLKQFFRELPECLLTDKLSEVFLAITQHVPQSERTGAMWAAVALLPCENREVLHALLDFLSFVADHSSSNQMTASNLAVCFAPSLFSMSLGCIAGAAAGKSPKAVRKNSGPSADHISDLLDQKYAHECLKQMLDDRHQLFLVPKEFSAYTLTSQADTLPRPLAELFAEGSGYRGHVDHCIRGLLKEFRGKPRGWTADRLPSHCRVESLTVTVSHKRARDSCPLPLWKASTEVEAPPVEVLTRLLRERHLWDDEQEVRCCGKALDNETELVHFSRRRPCSADGSCDSHDTSEHFLLRSWRTQLQEDPGACLLISHSVDPSACTATSQHSSLAAGIAPNVGANALAVTYASHYLVQPCGAGRSRVTHVSCVDFRGRLPNWYERHYACSVARTLTRLRDSFRQQHACVADASMPETSL